LGGNEDEPDSSEIDVGTTVEKVSPQDHINLRLYVIGLSALGRLFWGE
jgi:hypothetical protein